MMEMRIVPSRMIGNWPLAVAALICSPRPSVVSVLPPKYVVLGEDAGVPRASGGGHHARDQEGKDSRQDQLLPAIELGEAEEGGDLLEVGGDGHCAGDDVEQDVPLGPHQHECDRSDSQAVAQLDQRKQNDGEQKGRRDRCRDLRQRLG